MANKKKQEALVPQPQNGKEKPSISLSEAKSLYGQGGTAKEIAMKFYSEDEITAKNDIVPSWEGAVNNLSSKEGHEVQAIGRDGTGFSIKDGDQVITPHFNARQSLVAYAKLMTIAYNSNLIHGKDIEENDIIYAVSRFKNGFTIEEMRYGRVVTSPIVFATKQIARECVKENKQLWKDYFMMD